ncbi:MAG: 3-methyl-2-oxobutanoate hydroxymethyltransferase [Deltaproteobacteria bacterium]|nr:MAG: 3-methyl-2-oxobutanoate hydroxymethyltransferase [Deltaproteobacteria bacterium]
MKDAGEKAVMVTAYDFTMARILDDAGVDMLLVGDSLGNVIQGHDSTLPVRLEHVIYHTAAVRRAVRRAHLVADMPFMSYQASAEEAVKNAGRLLSEGGAEAVKLEGGRDFSEVVRRIVRAGIPVMGHIGLTPQSVHQLGGYVVQGKTEEQAERLLDDALALQEAGIYALVLEAVPADVAARITEALAVPTIGIGAGPHCDAQVLVCYDLLGLNPDFRPKFVKRYLDGYDLLKGAVERYATEVRSGAFPAPEHSFERPVRVVKEEEGPGRLYGGGRSS